MNFSIIIPAHNEATVIAATLESLTLQTLLPKQLIVVNDHSTDATQMIIDEFVQNFSWIQSIEMSSSAEHLPGSKIINAFYKGFELLEDDFDVICKFDADLIFPTNYLETLASHFKHHSKLGMVAGFCYIEKDGEWKLENLTSRDHIRGALKAYRKNCFKDIGGLKPAMGWDTIDELLAKYYGWQLLTDPELKVKHLKPTGASYNQASKLLQGEAMYRMRYGFLITLISALKLAYRKKQIRLFKDYIVGFFKAKNEKLPYLVSEDQGHFIRQERRNGIMKKLFISKKH